MSGIINIQLFGAGSSVHTTDSYIDANTKLAMPYNGTGENTKGLAAEMKTFYDKTLIELAGPALVHDQFAQKRPIPRNGGKTIEFRKFNALPKALKPITEGVTPNGSRLTVVPVTATVDQYGDYVELLLSCERLVGFNTHPVKNRLNPFIDKIRLIGN